MFANYLIGLREGLEAALVVGILLAYVIKCDRRDLIPGLWAGVTIAVVGSLAFGAVLVYGPQGLTFEAQEAIGGSLSIVAVALITWMIFWMASVARHLKGELEGRLEVAMASGGAYSVAMIAMLAVGREGLETALFLWAGVQSAGSGAAPVAGAVLGLATALVLGYLFYAGALRLNLRRFFTWTGGLLIVVAAGVLAYGMHDLQEAGILPGLQNLAFDVSATVPPTSWYGALLKGLFNFSPATTWLEAAVWLLYLVPVLTVFIATTRRPVPAARPAPTAPVGHVG